MNSIPQTANQRQYRTVEDIEKGCCPECGHELSIAFFHLGGEGYTPYVVCNNPDGGYAHHQVRISRSLAMEHDDFIRGMESAFGVWEEDHFEEEVA